MTRASNPKTREIKSDANHLSQKPKCPHCGSKKNSKAGKRKTKRKTSQRYRCSTCTRSFSIQPLHRVSYPPKVILKAISLYNQGYTLKETRTKIRTRFKMDPKEATIHLWLTRYKNICTFYNLRKKYNINPKEIIFTKKFHHQQVYEYKYHKLKLNILGKQFPELKSYLTNLPEELDNKLFKDSLRCSDFPFDLNFPKPRAKRYSANNATKIAGFGKELAKSNRERHQAIEDFFLVNDSATVATEIPVFLTPKEARAHRISIPRTLTGHIDILQIRGKKIRILDYKPEVKNNRQIEKQLVLYAIAIERRTAIPLSNIICAYFDEKAYYQFSTKQ
jgi:transcription elongation factor Elf1